MRRWSVSRWLSGSIDQSVETKIEGYLGEPVFTPDRSIMALSEAGVFEVETGQEISLTKTPGLLPNFRRFSDDGRWLLATMVNTQTGDKADACLFEMPSGAIGSCIFERTTGSISDADMDGAAKIITYREIVGDEAANSFLARENRKGFEINM